MEFSRKLQRLVPVLTVSLLAGISGAGLCQDSNASTARSFTIAVIPDTQNYVDYRHQVDQGFKFNARDMFTQQLQYVSEHAVGSGGDIAFLTHVGDVWQHQVAEMDAAHTAKGMKAIPNPWLKSELEITPLAQTVEMPAAQAAFSVIDGKLPFSVVPGNHDYDAMWSDSRFPPVTDVAKLRMSAETLGMLHMGGLSNFKQVFSANSSFFKGKPWYISSYNDGANSAQRFNAGGYSFLHVALEMAADDGALAWARKVIDTNPGMPTIVTTHDFLNTDGSRTSNPIIDPKVVDPDHNGPQDMWNEFFSKNDQIFLVLSGHEHGQAYREDLNDFGHKVYQVLADYQNRGQSGLDAGVPMTAGLGGKTPVAIGDGWMRLMQFNMDGNIPSIHVRTYSTFYKGYSTELANYASWYKGQEDPKLTDAQFLAEDDFIIPLVDFQARFGK